MKGEILSIETVQKIAELENLNDKLSSALNSAEDRIDKAIEYIKENNCIAVNKEYLPKDYEYCCSYDLLNILQGENNE